MLLTTLMGLSQTITVKDEVTLEPLEVVAIFDPSTQRSAITNSRGQADLSDFKGADTIYFSRLGYDLRAVSFEVLEALGYQLLLNPNDFNLDEVVVSATRWQQLRRDIPQKMTLIDSRQVAFQNPQTAADLLGRSGEVYIQKSQLGGGSPMIRGFATNRLLLSVDGVRMNNAIFRSGNLQNVISIDPFAVDETEVVHGPGSVIYGSDAIGGVMSFYTLRPKVLSKGKALVQGSATLRSSSANFEKTAHAKIGIGVKKWGFITSFTVSDFEDLRMGSNGPDDYLRPEYVSTINGEDLVVANSDPEVQVATGYSQMNLMQKIRFKPNEHWDLNYGAHYSATSDVPRYDRLTRYRGGQLRSAEWYYGPQEWMMHTLNVLHTDSNTIYDKASFTVAYQRFGESRHDRDFGSDLLQHQTERVDAFSANLDFEQEFGSRHRIFYGLEGVYNVVDSRGEEEDVSTGLRNITASRYPDGATWASYAAYITHQLKASEKVTLHGGLRYNIVQLRTEFDTTLFPLPFAEASVDADALNGSLGIAYKPTKTWQFNANLSTGFRAPNVDDIGKVFASEPGSVVVPNADLQAEYAYNAEFGIVKVFGKTLKIDFTGFYTLLDRALVRRDFQLNGQDSILYRSELSRVQAIQNAAQAQVYGIQAGVEWKFLKSLTLSSRFNWQRGEEELDDGSTAPLRHAAPWFGVTQLIYSRQRLQVSAYAEYNGEVSNSELAPSEQSKDFIYAADENGNPYAPAWYTLNLKAMYQITEWVSVNAGVENITDQRYRPYSSGIAAPGRNFIGALRVRF